MYDLIRGPLLWISFVIFFAGIIYRVIQLFMITRKKETPAYTKKQSKKLDPKITYTEEQKYDLLLRFQNSLLGKNPVMAIVSFIFHSCLFIAPIFAAGHSLSLYESWGISFISLPDKFIDLLTIIVLACVLFFLICRIVIPRVKSISTPYDYLLFFISAAPFITGFYAYHHYFDYKTIITLHIAFGELMLIVMPFTKLGHMVFFFFVRILIGGEHSFGKGKRAWS